MSDELLEVPTPSPTPVPANHAESRPGLNAPHPPATSDSWESMGHRFDQAITLARDLFRTTRHPMQDALYARIRFDLAAYESAMEQALRRDPSDPVAAECLREVRRYLGRPDR